MGRIDGKTLGAWLLCALLPASAQADTDWRIFSPYPGNPLKVAVLDGQGHVGAVPFPVTLELSCHPGVTVPRAVLRVPQGVADWDFTAFDGPAGGVDQRRKTLTIQAQDARVLDRPWFSGIRGERDSYMLSWMPNEAFLARVALPGDWVSIQLVGVRRSLGAMEAHFDFPVPSTAMLAAISPCSQAMARKSGS